jgi:hypothetical protein
MVQLPRGHPDNPLDYTEEADTSERRRNPTFPDGVSYDKPFSQTASDGSGVEHYFQRKSTSAPIPTLPDWDDLESYVGSNPESATTNAEPQQDHSEGISVADIERWQDFADGPGVPFHEIPGIHDIADSFAAETLSLLQDAQRQVHADLLSEEALEERARLVRSKDQQHLISNGAYPGAHWGKKTSSGTPLRSTTPKPLRTSRKSKSPGEQ